MNIKQKRYIGQDRPSITYRKIYFREPSMFADSDNMPSDPEQADWYDIND